MQNRAPIIETLLQLDPPKTWSLIATVFGDLQGGTLSGKQLGLLLGNAGVKPEAIRVALHRLKQEGWIVSQKSGREVIYTLSASAQAETIAAGADVYRMDVKFGDGWRAMVLGPEAQAETVAGPSVLLGRSLVLVPRDAHVEPANGWVLDIPDGTLPEWVGAQLMPAHLAATAQGLVEQSKLFANEATNLNAADRVTARLMFLHHWRKLALRTSTWAHIGLEPDGVLAQCHRSVTALLANTNQTTAPQL